MPLSQEARPAHAGTAPGGPAGSPRLHLPGGGPHQPRRPRGPGPPPPARPLLPQPSTSRDAPKTHGQKHTNHRCEGRVKTRDLLPGLAGRDGARATPAPGSCAQGPATRVSVLQPEGTRPPAPCPRVHPRGTPGQRGSCLGTTHRGARPKVRPNHGFWICGEHRGEPRARHGRQRRSEG